MPLASTYAPGDFSAVSVPLVSVVVPTYNRAPDVRRCLTSLARQDYAAMEVLVCDDGSTDDTAEVVSGFAGTLNVRFLPATGNFGGPARPRNAGVREARGTYVAFLDSDDWWAPEKLTVSVTALERGADVVYHDLVAVGASRGPRLVRSRELTHPVYEDLILRGNALNTSSVVARTTLLRGIGGFLDDPALIAVEDFECWLRLAQLTDNFVRIPGAPGFYWMGGGHVSNPDRTLRGMQRLREMHFASFLAERGMSTPPWLAQLESKSHLGRGDFAQAQRALAAARGPATARQRLRMALLRLKIALARR